MDTKPIYPADGHELLDKRLIPNLAKNVKALRKGAKLSKKTFHQMVGIGRPLLNKIEKGTADPRISLVTRIADALGVSPEELLFGTPDEASLEDGSEQL